MFKQILSKINDASSPENKTFFDQIFTKLESRYPNREDPWGLNLRRARKSLERVWPLYKHYFKVRCFGLENISDQPFIVVANHSGQIAIDGMLICSMFSTEVEPPRILRPMVERFFTGIPFIGSWAAEGGAVLGDRQNCINLLERKESVLVFPEGVRGIAKDSSDFYEMKSFGRGFFRIALATGVPILPIAVVGAEEFYPLVWHPLKLAKKIGLPAFPITPNLVPLPSPVDIHVGKPFVIPKELSADAPDSELDIHIDSIHASIQKMLDEGLQSRREFIGNKVSEKFSARSSKKDKA
tara:strand:- start:969 stop:1859 length:891 start_codon:yes stop_codon:yes gene_type:complete